MTYLPPRLFWTTSWLAFFLSWHLLPAQVGPLVRTHSLRAGDMPARTRISAPPASQRAAATAIFLPTYTGLPAAAQAAAQYALDIWATELFQAFPISLDVVYLPLPAGELSRTSTTIVAGFSGNPTPGTAYPIALANGLAGCDLEPGVADFTIELNSTVAWHMDPLTAPTAGTYDLATVMLHDLALGLGIAASFVFDDGVAPAECFGTPGTGCYDLTPYIFETLTEDQFGTPLRTIPNFSAALGGALISDALFWNGPQAAAALGGTLPKLYAPDPFVPGASVIHLDEATYPPGNPHSLLTPVLDPAEVIHDPGDVLRGMLADIGWTLANTATAYFTVPTTWYTGTPLAFTDRSPQGLAWAWDFEDDGTVDATVQYPTHTYPAPGSYTARLTLNGDPALTFTQVIEVFDPPAIPFTLTFDAGAEGFFANGPGCASWELGTPSTPLLASFGPIGGAGQGWATHLHANHGTESRYYLDSPPIHFVGAVGDYFLRFNFYWVAASDAGMNVLYSTDGGNTWTVLGGVQGVDLDADVDWYTHAALPVLDGQAGWQIPFLSANVFQPSYRITALAPNTDVRFRIQFASGSSFPQEGIVVDNFQIQGQVLPALPPSDLTPAEGTGFALYPNPVPDYLTLRLPAPATASTGHFKLYDLQGRLCREQTWTYAEAAEVSLFLGDLPAGAYLYRWTSEGDVQRGRLLKQ